MEKCDIAGFEGVGEFEILGAATYMQDTMMEAIRESARMAEEEVG